MNRNDKKRHRNLALKVSIESRILLLRGQRVIIDKDLAGLYGVKTKVLNQTVKRNIKRFPERYMFKLSKTEKHEVVTNCDHLIMLKFSPQLPFAFTEYGVVMVATILNSKRAIQMSIFIVDAFVRLRTFLSTHKELAQKVEELERKIGKHEESIQGIIKTIKQLMALPEKPRKKIGF